MMLMFFTFDELAASSQPRCSGVVDRDWLQGKRSPGQVAAPPGRRSCRRSPLEAHFCQEKTTLDDKQSLWFSLFSDCDSCLIFVTDLDGFSPRSSDVSGQTFDSQLHISWRRWSRGDGGCSQCGPDASVCHVPCWRDGGVVQKALTELC